MSQPIQQQYKFFNDLQLLIKQQTDKKYMKKLWLIWARTLDHRVGRTDNDQPDIPILSLKDAQISLILRTIIVVLNIVTCFFIIANVIRHW